MLLVIALAHAPGYLFARDVGLGGFPVPAPWFDQLTAAALLELVVGRGYPLFAALFGYGLMRLFDGITRTHAAPAAARATIRRRGMVLLLFGIAHAAVLFSGDILGAYGVLALAAAPLVLRARRRMLLILVTVSLVAVTAGGATSALDPVGPVQTVFAESNPVTAVGQRLAEWAPALVLQPLGLVGAVALGAWAARRGLLDQPHLHRPLLRRIAVVGVGIAVLGGLPLALMATAAWPDPSVAAVMAAGCLHAVSGYGGLGYAAAIALLAGWVTERPGRVVRALSACGQRSLSCYLAQSVVFVALLAAYGGGLGSQLGVAQAAGVGVLTWLLTVVLADLARRLGHRGPAEFLLRRWAPRSPTRENPLR